VNSEQRKQGALRQLSKAALTPLLVNSEQRKQGALRAGGERKPTRPNFPAPALAGGNFFCSLFPVS
jgi:hypothetical protein